MSETALVALAGAYVLILTLFGWQRRAHIAARKELEQFHPTQMEQDHD